MLVERMKTVRDGVPQTSTEHTPTTNAPFPRFTQPASAGIRTANEPHNSTVEYIYVTSTCQRSSSKQMVVRPWNASLSRKS
jgi:hypothetical protein